MDLALEFGISVEQLSRSMKERELVQWYQYAGRKMLPKRRQEWYLGQIAFYVMRAVGATEIELSDFVFETRTFEEWQEDVNKPKEPNINEMRAAFGLPPKE